MFPPFFLIICRRLSPEREEPDARVPHQLDGVDGGEAPMVQGGESDVERTFGPRGIKMVVLFPYWRTCPRATSSWATSPTPTPTPTASWTPWSGCGTWETPTRSRTSRWRTGGDGERAIIKIKKENDLQLIPQILYHMVQKKCVCFWIM